MVAAVVAGGSLLGSAAVVWRSTHAAFSATTSNAGNTWSAGSVAISDNDNGVTMFNVTGMAPSATGTVCIGVRYTGSLTPTDIRLYTANAQESLAGAAYVTWANSTAAELDDYLSMRVEINNTNLAADPGSNCAPSGVGTFADVIAAGTTMRTIIGTYTNYTTGRPTGWGTVATGTWRVFRFTYLFSASAPDSAQSDGLKVDFVWEAQR